MKEWLRLASLLIRWKNQVKEDTYNVMREFLMNKIIRRKAVLIENDHMNFFYGLAAMSRMQSKLINEYF